MARFGMLSMARRLATALAFLAVSAPHAAVAVGDGAWRLTIEGHQTFLFGEPRLSGGIRIPWEVVIEFEVRQGEYGLGSGSARWLGNEETLSRPPGWFACSQVDGTYLDSISRCTKRRVCGLPLSRLPASCATAGFCRSLGTNRRATTWPSLTSA
ncbi:MAG: hypothetical protein WBM67_00380 [Sedimenticolaceae bacterium]